MRNRGLKPRSRGQYDNEEHGRRESTLPPDDQTLNQSVCRMNLMRPRYNEGPMIARFWPALDFDHPDKPCAGRKSLNPHGVSHFIVRASVAKYIGLPDPACEKTTFILYEPWNSQAAKKNNPYRALFFACKEAHKSGKFGPQRKWDAEWNQILIGGKGKGAALSGPTAVFFAQGHVYANGDKDYCSGDRSSPMGLDEADDLVVIQMPGSAGDNFLDLLDTPKHPDKQVNDESQPWLDFVYGDPVGVYDDNTGAVNGGLIVTIFNPKKTKISKNSSWDGTIADIQGYEVAVSKGHTAEDNTNYAAGMTAEQVQRVKDKWQFWWDDSDTGDKGILRVPSIEEQAVLIAKAFVTVPKMLEFGWADHENFLTDEVMGILRQRRSAVVPGDDNEYDTGDESGGVAQPTGARSRKDPSLGRNAAAAAANDDFDANEDLTEPQGVGRGAAATDEFEEDVAAAAAGIEVAATSDDFDTGDDTAAANEEIAVEAADEFETGDVVTGDSAVEAEAVVETETETADDTFPDDVGVADEGDLFSAPATGDDEFAEDTTEPEPVNEPPAAKAGGKKATPAASASTAEDKMRTSMNAAMTRAGKRASVQAAPPTPAAKPPVPAGKPAATGKPAAAAAVGKPAPAPAGKPTAGKPAPAPAGKPASAPATGKPGRPAPAPPAKPPVKKK